MAVQIYSTATEYLANSLTFARGSIDDVIKVGVYHTLNPSFIPQESDFIEVDIVGPGDALAQGDTIDVLSLIGPASLNPTIVLAPGDYQRWVLVKTATEVIIRKVDLVEVV
jgi:hypothetical protein